MAQQIKQREEEARHAEGQITYYEKKLALVKEQIGISESLVKNNLSSRYEHINHLREQIDLEAQIKQAQSSLVQTRSALSEARILKEALQNGFIEQAQEELTRSHNQLAEFDQRIQKYQDNWKRTIIRSPVNGIVKATLFNFI